MERLSHRTPADRGRANSRAARTRAAVVRLTTALLVAILAMGTAMGWAQGFGRRFRLPEGAGSYPPRYPPKGFSDGSFTLCKLQYESSRSEFMGIGWSTDYPYAGVNLMTRLSELTRTHITRDSGNSEPVYWVVRATDEAMFQCPVLMASDVGTMELTDAEASRLGQYLEKGGFLWVDDFWGSEAWDQWVEQIHRAVPGRPIFDIPPEHPIRHMMFPIDEVEQVTNIQNWMRTRSTSERGADSPHADFRGIADDRGRLMVVMTHNTDFGDSWERESENRQFFETFSPKGYAMGVNVLLYALTH